VGLLSTQMYRVLKCFVGRIVVHFVPQIMQYSGFLRMRSESNFADSYGGPRLSRRGGGGRGDRLYKQQEQLRIYTKVKFYS
jgi:hypothetical protein